MKLFEIKVEVYNKEYDYCICTNLSIWAESQRKAINIASKIMETSRPVKNKRGEAITEVENLIYTFYI